MAVFKKKKGTQHYVHRKNDVICHVKVEGGGGAEREGEEGGGDCRNGALVSENTPLSGLPLDSSSAERFKTGPTSEVSDQQQQTAEGPPVSACYRSCCSKACQGIKGTTRSLFRQ